MSLQRFSFCPKDALPDEALLDSVLSFRKLDDASRSDRYKNGSISKLRKHMEYLAERESIWLLKAFELMYNTPEVTLMLGGSGLEQANVLAKMLKQEGDRLYAENLIQKHALEGIREFGPLGMGKSIDISTAGVEGIVYSNKPDFTPKDQKVLRSGTWMNWFYEIFNSG